MKLFLGKKVDVKIILLEKPSEIEIVPFEQKNLFLEDNGFCLKCTQIIKIIFDNFSPIIFRRFFLRRNFLWIYSVRRLMI